MRTKYWAVAALSFKYQKREPSAAEQTTETETVYSNKHDNFRGTQRLYSVKQLFEGASIA